MVIGILHNVPFDPNSSPEFTQKGSIENTCRDIIVAATLPPRHAIQQCEQLGGKKAAPLHRPNGKNHHNINEDNREGRMRFRSRTTTRGIGKEAH